MRGGLMPEMMELICSQNLMVQGLNSPRDGTSGDVWQVL